LFAFLSYFFSLIALVISVFITLFFKNELEQMFEEKKAVVPFHICNVLIILMVSMAVYAVMTVYVFGHTFNFLLQLVIFILIILPIYLFGNFVFEKYKLTYRKYRTTENKKVIVLNEKYLKRKRRLSKLKKYNSFFREEK
jgi:hypothetical protein